MAHTSLLLQDWRSVWRFSQRVIVLLVLSSLASPSEDAGAAQIRLTWTNNADNADGFKIERRTGTTGPFTLIATQRAQQNSYLDTNLQPETQYCYRVKAFNVSGESAYSNETCVTTTSLVTTFESPEDGQPVAGIAVLRGWAFDTQGGRQISSIELLIDDKSLGDLPCCSGRGDVQAAFPQYPSLNTLNSGWATVVNWGLLSSGRHTVQVKVKGTSGETVATEPRTVSVVKAGEYEFLDQFSLSRATVRIEGEMLVLDGVVVRDSASQQQKEITARFRWLSSMQSLAMVETETRSQISSLHAPLTSLIQWFWGKSLIAGVQAAPGTIALLESPAPGQMVSGVSVLRGWAFSEEPGVTVQEIHILVDGQPLGVVPCCSERGDVAAAFPGNSNARGSGWGITVNYGNLFVGPHTLSAQITDSKGGLHSLEQGFQVVQIGGFAFLDEFTFSGATAWIEGDDIVLSRVHVRDKASGQTRLVTARLRWFQNSQALGIVASTTESG